MKRLLILENDVNVDYKDRHRIVGDFKEGWENEQGSESEVTLLSNLSQRDSKEIFQEFVATDDIAFETSFIAGSDSQTVALTQVLAKIKEPKNIYIGYYGLRDKLIKLLSDEEIHSIKHHKIYTMRSSLSKCELLDFSEIVNKVSKAIKKDKDYKDEAKKRTTGLRVKVLGCSARGEQFSNLPIGEVVDVLDMSKQDPNQTRGVWIQGNGEPIKLVNDNGLQEYEVVEESKTDADVTNIILTTLNLVPSNVKIEDYEYIEEIIKNRKELQGNLGNEICDTLKIPRRGNRQRINTLLENANSKPY